MSSLGIPGYTFADLHDPERLASLYERFCEEVEAADPGFWGEWDAYRQAPDAPRTPLALSNLLVGMAPYVSRFLTRLFQVEPRPAMRFGAIDARPGRPLPLQDRFRQAPRAAAAEGRRAHVVSTPEDDAVVKAADRSAPGPGDRLELAIARAGCALMDREKAGDSSDRLSGA